MACTEFSGWLLWTLPLLFGMHDLEETLSLSPWLRRNRTLLARRFPKLSARLLPYFDRITSPLFAAMAAEEGLVLIGVTLYASLSGGLLLWLALFLAFTVHLLIHVIQWLVVGRYIPGIGTTLCCLPCCGYVLWIVLGNTCFSAGQIILYTATGCFAAALNLLLIHRLAFVVVSRNR